MKTASVVFVAVMAVAAFVRAQNEVAAAPVNESAAAPVAGGIQSFVDTAGDTHSRAKPAVSA